MLMKIFDFVRSNGGITPAVPVSLTPASIDHPVLCFATHQALHVNFFLTLHQLFITNMSMESRGMTLNASIQLEISFKDHRLSTYSELCNYIHDNYRDLIDNFDKHIRKTLSIHP